jgi:VWFA-related protein
LKSVKVNTSQKIPLCAAEVYPQPEQAIGAGDIAVSRFSFPVSAARSTLDPATPLPRRTQLTARQFPLAALLSSLCLLAPRVDVVAQRAERAQRLGPSKPAGDTPVAGASAPAPVNIRINVVVTDRRGRSLLDLKPADFALDDNGIAQALTSVELRTPAPPARPGAGAITPVLTDDDERKAAQEAGTRVIALYLDEFNVAPGVNSERVRDAARRFLTEYVRPGDLIHVLKPLDRVSGFRFTRDRIAAGAMIDGFEGRKGDYTAKTSFENEFFGRTPEAVDSARAQIVTTGLRELTMKMGDLRPTRCALVLISEGFVRGPGAERRRLPDWQSLARAASHFSLPIYTFDPRDPAPASTDPDSPPAKDRGLDTLQSIAAQTGGEAVTDGRDLVPALARLSRDLDSYYVLTYQPSQATDGRFHPIAVRTTRKDVQIRVPSGYWSPLSSEWRTWLDRASAPSTPSGPVRTLRRSRLIDMWYGFERADDGRLAFVFTWEPSSAGAALRSQPRVVLLKVSTPQGATLFEREVQAVAPADQSGADDRAVFSVPTGRMQLDLSVRAVDGTEIDTSAQDVDVPATRGAGPVLLQAQIVRARTVRDFRTLSAQPDAAPTPSRIFRRSERLLIRVPAYNPDGAPVTTSAVVSNIRGTTIRTLEPIPMDRGAPQFDLPLAFLAPGEYGIELKVTSPTGTARQLIRFRLIG